MHEPRFDYFVSIYIQNVIRTANAFAVNWLMYTIRFKAPHTFYLYIVVVGIKFIFGEVLTKYCCYSYIYMNISANYVDQELRCNITGRVLNS